jgi:hypothetical protein
MRWCGTGNCSSHRERLFALTVRRIRYDQRRNAVARPSHTRRATVKLDRQGITLGMLPRSDEETS